MCQSVDEMDGLAPWIALEATPQSPVGNKLTFEEVVI